MSTPPLRLALIGHPVGHSRSPAMHRAALSAMGLQGDYEAWDVPPGRLAEALERLRREGYAGFNVTAPHKRAVAERIDALTPLAAEAGAVNTVVRTPDGRWRGHNTDAEALASWLREAGRPPRPGEFALVLGTGGAARALLAALRRAGCHLAVAGRRIDAARRIVRSQAGERALDLRDTRALRAVLRHTAFLLQASSATFGGGERAERFVRALPLDAVPQDALVGDLVYTPRQTALLRAAAARGLRTADGLAFLVHQGARSLHHWTGHEPPRAVMRSAAAGLEAPEAREALP